jgi:hypothetical protein
MAMSRAALWSASTTRRRAALIALAAALAATASTATAQATVIAGASASVGIQPTVTAGVSANGVLAGNVIQIPVTAVTPIQVCNNNVAAGVIAVAVDALTSQLCAAGDSGVVNGDVDFDLFGDGGAGSTRQLLKQFRAW